MRGRVTKKAVDQLAPAARVAFLWDTKLRGFGLRVTPAGAKSFVVQYAAPGVAGVKRRVTLGAYGRFTVEEAASRARDLLGRVARGDDPAAERADARREVKEHTVAKLADEYLDECRAKMRRGTAAEYERIFRVYIMPALGKLPVASVTVRDVAHLHLAHRDKPSQSNRVLSLVKSYLYWCERRGLRAPHSNPACAVKPFAENVRERFLTAAELGRLGAALRTAETTGLRSAPEHRKHPKSEATHKHRAPSTWGKPVPASPYAVAAIRFLLFTGWRESEALTLKWEQLDTSRAIATLPRTKTGRSMRPLGAPALELLATLPRVMGSPYVFPSPNDPAQPLREIKRVWCAVRYAADLMDCRLHDLRHTVASMAVGTGHSLYLTGALLGHANAATTQRYAHLAVDARQATADAVAGAIRAALEAAVDAAASDAAADVVPLTRAGGAR